MSNDEFKLPGTSLEALEKIMQAYAQRDTPTTNDEIAKVVGLEKTTVSRSNGFLGALGLIEGGSKKQPTSVGKRLGMALHHEQKHDAAALWRDAIANSKFLTEQLTAVRVQKGVAVDDLPGKILYNAGAKKNHYTKLGAKTVVDLLVSVGLLKESGGKYEITKGTKASPQLDTSPEETQGSGTDGAPYTSPNQAVGQPPSSPSPIQYAINLQIQLPEFDDPKKYKELFSALRKHLIEPDDSE